ncbi:MAG: tetratricopeptide repeat protein [Candidatus Kapabacteria bacterium]|nr:tetratricopeptide repeat protein [Candidatus Kapabacteria bacterium]
MNADRPQSEQARALEQLWRSDAAQAFERCTEYVAITEPCSADGVWFRIHKARCEMLLGRLPEAMTTAREAVELATSFGNPWLRGKAMSELGVQHYCNDEYETARLLHSSVIDVMRECGLPADVARATINYANCEVRLQNEAEAVVMYEEAIDIARRSGDRIVEAVAYGNLVNLYLGSFVSAPNALPQIERAIELYRDLGDRVGHVHVLEAKARILLDEGRYDEAKVIADEAENLEEAYKGEAQSSFDTAFLQGVIAYRRMDMDRMRLSTRRCDSIAEEVKHPFECLLAAALRALECHLKGDLDGAALLLEESYQGLKTMGRTGPAMNMVEILHQIEYERGNFAQSLAYRKLLFAYEREQAKVRTETLLSLFSAQEKRSSIQRFIQSELERRDELQRRHEQLQRVQRDNETLLRLFADDLQRPLEVLRKVSRELDASFAPHQSSAQLRTITEVSKLVSATVGDVLQDIRAGYDSDAREFDLQEVVVYTLDEVKRDIEHVQTPVTVSMDLGGVQVRCSRSAVVKIIRTFGRLLRGLHSADQISIEVSGQRGRGLVIRALGLVEHIVPTDNILDRTSFIAESGDGAFVEHWILWHLLASELRRAGGLGPIQDGSTIRMVLPIVA